MMIKGQLITQHANASPFAGHLLVGHLTTTDGTHLMIDDQWSKDSVTARDDLPLMDRTKTVRRRSLSMLLHGLRIVTSTCIIVPVSTSTSCCFPNLRYRGSKRWLMWCFVLRWYKYTDTSVQSIIYVEALVLVMLPTGRCRNCSAPTQNVLCEACRNNIRCNRCYRYLPTHLYHNACQNRDTHGVGWYAVNRLIGDRTWTRTQDDMSVSEISFIVLVMMSYRHTRQLQLRMLL